MADEFKILLATDIHLGYQHKHELRGKDSLNTFEEILRIARDKQVDFVLLGGDLFHENKPPRHIVNGAIQLLREYTFGDKEIEFDIVSDLAVNFEAHGPKPWPNFHDENLNVAIPVFSIHGNHDDPTGCGAANAGVTLSVLNTLADAGVINYFGRQNDLQEVRIHPILFEKGTTKLAVFGLGALREERLHRLWRENKVHLMQQPGADRDKWFNMFVIHQNRVRHTDTTYVPEESIDRSMDLVLWGHEHDCQVEPVKNQQQEFYVIQPGSSVATSLIEGETTPKHVAILRVLGKHFKVEPVPLKTVRQFYWKDIFLHQHVKEDITDKQRKEQVEKFCKTQVEKLLLVASQEKKPEQPPEPLIRLRVHRAFKSGLGAFDTFNLYRFGEQFKGRVANTKDIIQFKLSKPRAVKTENPTSFKVDLDEETVDEVGNMKDVVVRCLTGDRPEKDRLLVQSEHPLTEAMSQFVEKGVTDAIGDYVNRQIDNMAAKLEKRLNISTISKDGVAEDIRELAERRRQGNQDLVKEERDILDAALKTANSQKMTLLASRSQMRDADFDNDDDVDIKPVVSTSRVSRGSTKAPRASTRGTGRGRGRGRGKTTVVDVQTNLSNYFSQNGASSSSSKRAVIDIDDDDDDFPKRRRSKADEDNNNDDVSLKPEKQKKDPISVMNANRPSTTARGRTPKKKYFSDSDDDDYDATPVTSKRGRR